MVHTLKKIIQFAVLLLSVPAIAQTTGAPLNLALPNVHSPSWNVPMNNNFTIINTNYGLLAPKASPTFTGTSTFNNVIINGTCTGAGCGGGGAVSSVFGRAGAVTAAPNDYSFSQIGGFLNLTDQVTGILPIANGGNGTATPALIAGTNITITGSWPALTITASATAATAFSALTSATNTIMAALCGSGCSLGVTGTGTIAATSAPFTGLTGNLGTTQGPTSLTGLLKDTAGTLSAATAGTDYLLPTGSATGLSKASSSAFGVSECDNTTITCPGGIFTAVGGAVTFSSITGSTNSGGNALVVGSTSSLSTSGTGTIAATSAPFTGLTGTIGNTQFPSTSIPGTSGKCTMEWTLGIIQCLASGAAEIEADQFLGSGGGVAVTAFGTAASANTGTSGATVPLLNAAAAISAKWLFGGGDLFEGGVNAQTGTSYAIGSTDENKLLTFNNAASVAVSLSQATTAGFTVGAIFHVFNRGAGTVTITPATSTINGASTLVLAQGQGAFIESDGTNYSAWTTLSGGSSNITGLTAGFIPLAGSSTTLTGNSHCDDGVTTATTVTCSEPVAINASGSASQINLTPTATASATVAGAASIGVPATVTTPNVTNLPAAPGTGLLFSTNSSGVDQLTIDNVGFTNQSDGTTVTWAIASAAFANTSLLFTVHGGSRTLNLTGLVDGGSYVLTITQDSTGGEGLTLGSGCTWKVGGGGGGAITPSTAANAVDILAFTYKAANTTCYANFNKNFN